MQKATGESRQHSKLRHPNLNKGVAKLNASVSMSSIWRLFFILLTMQLLSSKYKWHCFLQGICDKGINLFSLNDTAFLNRLVAEAILWEKKILGNYYRVSWKYAPNSYSGCSCYLRPHAHEGGCCQSLLLTFLSSTKQHQSPPFLPPRWLYSMLDFFYSLTTKQMRVSR